MPEYHKTVSLSSPDAGDVMFAVYEQLVNANNAYMELAKSGSTPVVYIDTDGNGSADALGTPTSGANFPNGSYLVFQPPADYPGSGRWQCMFKVDGGEIKHELSYSGGWNQTDGAFTGMVTTGLLDSQSGTVGNVTKLYISCVRETYATSKHYYYFRMLWREGGDDCKAAWYIGGYIPFDTTADTKPVVCLANKPYGDGSAGAINCWENPQVNGSNRSPADYALSANTFCYVKSITNLMENSRGDDRAGNYIAPTVYLFDANDNVLGIFGTQTFRGFDTSVADWSMDSTASYMVTGSYLQRFKEGYR